jgi:ribosome biogenesis GTPase
MTVRIPGRMKKKALVSSDLPGVGDWVLVKPLDIGNMIFKILSRKNQISRKAAGKEVKEQLVAANIDVIFLVMGLDKDFNLRRLERFIFMVTTSSAKPVVILNKSDLVTDAEEKESSVRKVLGDEIEVHTISAITKREIVGKSTIINTLLDEDKIKTAEVRKKDSKGRHITKTRELFPIPGGGVMIDNPGIREVQLWGEPDSLQGVFKDIEALAINCKFKDCAHLNEPKCAVTQALKNGELSQQRYDNYQKMRKELEYLSQKMKMSAEAIKRSKWKGLKKNAKHYLKYKKNRD